jgi:hypothetical protein
MLINALNDLEMMGKGWGEGRAMDVLDRTQTIPLRFFFIFSHVAFFRPMPVHMIARTNPFASRPCVYRALQYGGRNISDVDYSFKNTKPERSFAQKLTILSKRI